MNTYSNRRVANHLHGLIFELKERMNSRQDRPVMRHKIMYETKGNPFQQTKKCLLTSKLSILIKKSQSQLRDKTSLYISIRHFASREAEVNIQTNSFKVATNLNCR